MPPLKRMLTETERAAIKAALPNHPIAQVIDEIIAVKESCYTCEHYYDQHCQQFNQPVPQHERNKHHECFDIRREDPF